MKVARLMTVLVLWCLFGCGSTNNNQQQMPNSIQQQVAFNTQKQGDVPSLSYSTPRVDVIRNEADWDSYWNQLFANSLKPALPSIDFQNTTVIAVLGGQYSSGGNSITINRIDITSAGAIVYATLGIPDQGVYVTATFTQPYHIVTISSTFTGTATLVLP